MGNTTLDGHHDMLIKLLSIFNSLILSILPATLRISENEESFWILSKNSETSSLVTPCRISKSIFLRTFGRLPPYLLCCFTFQEDCFSFSVSPETYFKIVFCICSKCHSFIG